MLGILWLSAFVSKETAVLRRWSRNECLALSTKLITKAKLATVKRFECSVTFQALALRQSEVNSTSYLNFTAQRLSE